MSSKDRKPRITARASGLRLTHEERFLVDRADGERSLSDLADLTGMEAERVERIMTKLASEGAVDLGATPPASDDPGDGEKTSMAEFAAALGMDPHLFAEAEPELAPPPPPTPPPQARLQPVAEVGSVRDLDAIADLVERPARHAGDLDIPDELPTLEDLPEPPSLQDMSAEVATEEGEGAEVADTAEAPEAAASSEASEEESAVENEVERAVAERNYREVYEKRWHPLPVEQRVEAARTATGPDLLALCFDHDARVIAAILVNPQCGLDHIRLIVFHHRTGTGLEIVARRQDWLRDLLVERRLLRNPMIGDIVLGRVMGSKRLLPTYKIAMDRDIPELSRVKCRGYVRQKWQVAAPEERADLLLRTEARCLVIMTGCTFDARTTAILCGRPINSAMFVQSVAKFGAAPPGLLAHLIKQPFVRKNAALKKMLLAHPNLPGDVKRML